MKSLIKKSAGLSELLLILPLFIGMLCVISWIGFLLIAKSKVEKHAWVVQMQKTYDKDPDLSQMNPDYSMESDFSWKKLVQLGNSFRGTLPKVFRGYLLTHSTSYKNLNLNGDSPRIIQHTYQAALMNKRNSEPNILPFNIQAEMIIPGKTMENDSITKILMWRQAMTTAGFDYSMLADLGYTELDRAGVPTAKVAKMLSRLGIVVD